LHLMCRLHDVQPEVHMFGHIHCGYGRTRNDMLSTLFVNCATCDESYEPVHAPQVIDL
jgi:Icc-related predicted phosphoesterase